DTIEDPTLYQDKVSYPLPANNSGQSPEAAETKDNPHYIRSASHTSQSALEFKEDSEDDEEEKGCMRGPLHSTADSSSHPKTERALLLVTHLEVDLTQLKESVRDTANSIGYIVKDLEELKDNLRNDIDKMKDLDQRFGQKRGILKGVKRKR
ncbi:hypothetical protein T440DRAFT_353602, partial [Plenodomus tracheiphilus IPT5]